MVRFPLMSLKISSMDRTFQDFSHGILNFFVAQNFVDFVIFTCLTFLGNYFYLKKRDS